MLDVGICGRPHAMGAAASIGLEGKNMSRRAFLKSSALAALGVAAGKSAWAFAGGPTTPHPLGLQLFTVMTPLEQDFEGTLRQVAAMGYREVETIGAFGRDPRYVRQVLDKVGLKSPSQHVVPGDLYRVFNDYVHHKIEGPQIQKLWQETATVEHMRATVEEGIERAKIMGQRYVVLQIVWPEQLATRELVDKLCKAMNMAGDLCARAGLVFSFHNHAVELAPVNGYVPYDLILQQTNPETVKLEMDVYWMIHGKADPLAYLQRHPGRYKQFHLKDSAPDGDFTTVGKGTLDLPGLIAAGRKAGVEHFYVEYDRSADPMKESREAFDYLKKFF